VADDGSLGIDQNSHRTRCPAGAKLPATSCLGALDAGQLSVPSVSSLPASKNLHIIGQQRRHSSRVFRPADEKLVQEAVGVVDTPTSEPVSLVLREESSSPKFLKAGSSLYLRRFESDKLRNNFAVNHCFAARTNL
jgi:hypothetical protein